MALQGQAPQRQKPRRWARWAMLPLVGMIIVLFGLLALSACGALAGKYLPPIPKLTPVITITAVPSLAPRWPTPTPSSAPTLAPPRPSATPTAPATPTLSAPLPTLTETPQVPPEKPTPAPLSFPYEAQVGAPWYIPAFDHVSQGCQWVGLAGQVFDDQGLGADEVLVVVSGMLEGQPVEWLALTSQNTVYGPGGYELALADHIPAEPQALAVQLFDLQGQALSSAFTFLLPAACERNLVIVNFQAAGPD